MQTTEDHIDEILETCDTLGDVLRYINKPLRLKMNEFPENEVKILSSDKLDIVHFLCFLNDTGLTFSVSGNVIGMWPASDQYVDFTIQSPDMTWEYFLEQYLRPALTVLFDNVLESAGLNRYGLYIDSQHSNLMRVRR